MKFLQSKQYITIAEFMKFALYNKTGGYYITQNPIGSSGDFITAPEISQLFGEIICIWAIRSWELMGKPTNLAILELGPGNGTLMDDFIRTSNCFPDFANACAFHMVEISEKLANAQKQKLSKHKKQISWHSSIEKLDQVPTIFIGNEFLDALPINQFIAIDNLWYEIVLTIRNNQIVHDYIKSDVQSNPAKNQTILEKNFEAESIIRQISQHVQKFSGAAIFIDYGYTNHSGHSTLQAVKNHKYANPFADIGSTDITAHVNFAELANTASEYVNPFVTTQKEFLCSFGIRERAEILKKNSDANKIFSALSRLLDDMYPLFKVMILEKHD